jgi:hypothetical protein
MFERLAREAGVLTRYAHKGTLGSREIQTSTK